MQSPYVTIQNRKIVSQLVSKIIAAGVGQVDENM